MMRKTARAYTRLPYARLPYARLAFATLSLLALMAPAPLLAQDLSDEELLNLFLAQRDAFRAAEAGDTSGATRGLTLVTMDNVDVVTETATLSAPASNDDSGAASGTTTGVEVAGAPAEPAAPGVDVAAGTVEVPAPPPDETMVAVAETTPTPVVLAAIPKDMQVNVRIEFEYDSAALTDAQKPKLIQLCNVMKAADIQLFRIVGHTDASGSDDYNQNLSLLRAKEVQRYFIKDCGIDPARLQAVGLGEKFIPEGTDPKAPGNRRVEFQALA